MSDQKKHQMSNRVDKMNEYYRKLLSKRYTDEHALKLTEARFGKNLGRI